MSLASMASIIFGVPIIVDPVKPCVNALIVFCLAVAGGAGGAGVGSTGGAISSGGAGGAGGSVGSGGAGGAVSSGGVSWGVVGGLVAPVEGRLG